MSFWNSGIRISISISLRNISVFCIETKFTLLWMVCSAVLFHVSSERRCTFLYLDAVLDVRLTLFRFTVYSECRWKKRIQVERLKSARGWLVLFIVISDSNRPASSTSLQKMFGLKRRIINEKTCVLSDRAWIYVSCKWARWLSLEDRSQFTSFDRLVPWVPLLREHLVVRK